MDNNKFKKLKSKIKVKKIPKEDNELNNDEVYYNSNLEDNTILTPNYESIEDWSQKYNESLYNSLKGIREVFANESENLLKIVPYNIGINEKIDLKVNEKPNLTEEEKNKLYELQGKSPSIDYGFMNLEIPLINLKIYQSDFSMNLNIGEKEALGINKSEYISNFTSNGLDEKDLARFAILHELGHANALANGIKLSQAYKDGGESLVRKLVSEDNSFLSIHPQYVDQMISDLKNGVSFQDSWSNSKLAEDQKLVYHELNSFDVKDNKVTAYEEAYADSFAIRKGIEIYGWDENKIYEAVKGFRLATESGVGRDHNTYAAIAAEQKSGYKIAGVGAAGEYLHAINCKLNEVKESDCSARDDLLVGDNRILKTSANNTSVEKVKASENNSIETLPMNTNIDSLNLIAGIKPVGQWRQEYLKNKDQSQISHDQDAKNNKPLSPS